MQIEVLKSKIHKATVTSCDLNYIGSITIDESLINEQAACYLIYAPVCGCNDVTYSNDCVAQNNGVLSFTEGACEETN